MPSDFRRDCRQCIYQSTWVLSEVLARAERAGIPASKIVRAMRLFAAIKVPADRLGGALVLVFGL